MPNGEDPKKKPNAPAAAGAGTEKGEKAEEKEEGEILPHIESMENQWKRFGVYIRKDTMIRPPQGDFLVYVLNYDDSTHYYQKGKIVQAKAITEDIVRFDGKEYVRIRSYSGLSYADELKGAKEVGGGPGSTQRASVLLGKSLVFKFSSGGSSLVGAMQETSRTLIAISAGIPHATVFGIHEIKGKFYEVEEKLDVVSSSKFFNTVKTTYQKIRSGVPTNEMEQKNLCLFIQVFNEFSNKLRGSNIGGDFKLNNLSFRDGNTSDLFATDLVAGMSGNPYMPMTYKEWRAGPAAAEGGEDQFLDPFIRLYYYAPQYFGGGRRKLLQTRRRKSQKSKTRRSNH